MMNAGKKAVAAVASAVLLACLGAGTAVAAQGWNSSSNPLVAQGYGSSAYAYGSWKITSSQGTRSVVDGYVKMNNADDHAAMIELHTLVNSGLCLASEYLNCTQSYYGYATANTDRVSSAAYRRVTADTGLSQTADYARARIRTVIDIPFRFDVVSKDFLTKGQKY